MKSQCSLFPSPSLRLSHSFAPCCRQYSGICYSMWCASVINEARLDRPPGTGPCGELTCRQVTVTVANLSPRQPFALARTRHHGKTVSTGNSSVTKLLYILYFSASFCHVCLELKTSHCVALHEM